MPWKEASDGIKNNANIAGHASKPAHTGQTNLMKTKIIRLFTMTAHTASTASMYVPMRHWCWRANIMRIFRKAWP